MKLLDLLNQTPLNLQEAKARIEHPEDLIFDDGLAGAETALQILRATAARPEYVSIKFDGSPALVFGWRGDDFVLTDKAGFSAKTYDGMTTSPEAIERMIMGRKIRDTSQRAVMARHTYAKKIASLYPTLKASVPKSFEGYAQGDLLYTGVPPIINGSYEFTPNKVTYRVAEASDLGAMIKKSNVGMVIHSVYSSQEDEEPEPIADARQLGFRTDSGLAILPHEATMITQLKLDHTLERRLHHQFSVHGPSIKRFLDTNELSQRELLGMPGLMKSFLAKRAERGMSSLKNLPHEFLEFLFSPSSKASGRMQTKIVDWVKLHLYGYNSVWRVVKLLIELKLDLKKQMDQQAGGVVGARLGKSQGHEGFVSVTPIGIVKFVNRAEFMKKQQSSTLTESEKPSVVWAFGRMNPITQGHQHLVDKVESLAKGGDYWIFLSHSHDGKKNPLPWETKLDFFKKIMPHHSSHIYADPNIKTPLQAADWLYNQGYRQLTFVAGSDRVDSMRDMLNSWNSPEIREKYSRDPVEIDVVSAGDRDPDAEGLSGISATKAREAAQNNDFESFSDATGLSDDLARELFKAVRSNQTSKKTKLKENSEHPNGTIVTLKMCEDSAARVRDWCKSHNIPCIDADALHLTVLFSRNPVPHLTTMHGNEVKVPAQVKGWKLLGDKALCLHLDCPLASRFHHSLRNQGGTHDFPDYIPHSSVSYEWADHLGLPSVLPDFPLLFNKIVVDDIQPNYQPKLS